MQAEELLRIIKKQPIPIYELQPLFEIEKSIQYEREHERWIIIYAFLYGNILGVQKECERRRKAAEKQKQRASIPVLDIHQMSDYKWQLNCLKSRLEHPENYADSENVEEVIAKLRQWLAEHSPDEPDNKDGEGLSELVV